MTKICKDGRKWGQNNSYHKLEYKAKLRKAKLGKNNPAWKDGESRTYIRNKYLLNEFIRFIGECQICQSKDKLLIHHKDNNYKNNDIFNLQVLCRACHNKVHKTRRKLEK